MSHRSQWATPSMIAPEFPGLAGLSERSPLHRWTLGGALVGRHTLLPRVARSPVGPPSRPTLPKVARSACLNPAASPRPGAGGRPIIAEGATVRLGVRRAGG